MEEVKPRKRGFLGRFWRDIAKLLDDVLEEVDDLIEGGDDEVSTVVSSPAKQSATSKSSPSCMVSIAEAGEPSKESSKTVATAVKAGEVVDENEYKNKTLYGIAKIIHKDAVYNG